MALTPIRQMDLSIHGKMLSVIEGLLADSAVATVKIADAAVTEPKIAPNTITNASIAQTASIADAALAPISTAGKVLNSATTATAANTADAIVARDANGGFSAGDVNVADLSASGGISIAGSLSLTGDLNVNSGKLTVDAATGDLNVNSGKLTVDAATGDVSMQGALSVGGNATLGADADVAGDLSVTGALSADGNATLGADLMVAGDSSLSGTLAVDGDLSVNTNKFSVAAATGNTIVGGTLSVDGDATMSGNLLASGDVTIQGNLAVNGTTTSVNSVDLVVNDRLVHLNEPATAGADDPVPTGLAGLSVHRGSEAGVEREHAGLVWDEGAQQFVMQMLAGDAAGSAKLDLEIKNLQAQEGSFQSDINGYETEIRLENDLVRFDLIGQNGDNNTYVNIFSDQFVIERTADNYATFSSFRIAPDGVMLEDQNGVAMLPTLDEHLVVKKYVDDADVLKFDKAGGAIDADGTVTLLVTDTSGATLGGQTLVFDADHLVNYDADGHQTITFGIDGADMQYLADTGNSLQTIIGPGSIQVNTSEANGNSNVTLGGPFSASTTLDGKTGKMLMSVDPNGNGSLIKLQLGDELVGLNAASAAVFELEEAGIKLVTRDLQAASNSQPSDTVLLPTDDAHLVVKKYVDDADTEILDKSGIVVGTQNTYSSTAVVADGDSLVTAIGKLDESVAEVAGKSYHEAFIYSATGGETSLAAPVGAPAIPDSAFTEVYIDGRKVFRGADKQFTVAVGGGSIEFAALTEGQTVELRYFA